MPPPPPLPPGAPPRVPTAVGERHEVGGFLFAFIHFSQLEHPTLVQRMVHLLIKSDVIHVAVVHVPRAVVVRRTDPPPEGVAAVVVESMLTAPTAYTAFIGAGFEEQPAEAVLIPCYELLFLPVPDPHNQWAGVDFLQSLRGAGYNYTALPLTILPRAWKRATVLPEWLTHEAPFDDLLFAAARPPQTRQAAEEVYPYFENVRRGRAANRDDAPPQYTHHLTRVFCSQMGLLLCYVCKAITRHTLDPAGCLPGELAQLLRDEAGAVPCQRQAVRVLADAPPPPSESFRRAAPRPRKGPWAAAPRRSFPWAGE